MLFTLWRNDLNHLARSFIAGALASALLIACGGSSDSDSPPPVGTGVPEPAAQPRLVFTVIAGKAAASPGSLDPNAGCVDGRAVESALGLGDAIVASVSGDVYLSERGSCDGKTRIRKVSPEGGIQTVAVGESLAVGQTGAPLSTFLLVSGLALNDRGELYIMDAETFSGGFDVTLNRYHAGQGPGLWRLNADGNVLPVAGVHNSVVSPYDSTVINGNGSDATFGFVNQICWGTDGNLYLDGVFSGVRRVSASGFVSSVVLAPGSHLSNMVCGAGGRVLALENTVRPDAPSNLDSAQYVELPSGAVVNKLTNLQGHLISAASSFGVVHKSDGSFYLREFKQQADTDITSNLSFDIVMAAYMPDDQTIYIRTYDQVFKGVLTR